MKKLILFAAILFSGVSVVNAKGNSDFGHSQGNSGNSGNNGNGGAVNSSSETVNLTVNLHAVQSISVTGDVVIDYLSAADYANGKKSNTSTELSVVSAGGFVIRVEAEDLKGGAKDIPASSIAVTAIAGDNGSGSYTPNVTLGKVATGTKAPLITSPKGGVDKKYSVSYKGADTNTYMENYNAGNAEKGTQVYTTIVTYTIAAN